ncbi:hypothetical protein D3C87_1774690 [compost metagenome]
MQPGLADQVDFVRVGEALAIVVTEPYLAVLGIPVETNGVTHPRGYNLGRSCFQGITQDRAITLVGRNHAQVAGNADCRINPLV